MHVGIYLAMKFEGQISVHSTAFFDTAEACGVITQGWEKYMGLEGKYTSQSKT